jgi:tRNA 2-thiocytidine biosynthesis protein TtcA
MAKAENRAKRTTRFFLRKVNRAISRYGLIEEGDRIAVAVSGGKDSLSLLRLLRERRCFYPLHYDLVAVHVAYIGWEVGAPPAEVMEAHFQNEGVPYTLEEVDFTGEEVDCFRCSWQRRKALFEAANRLGCNKVALAHNQEDIAETVLINLLLHGRLERPEPLSPLFGGKITLIRPLVFLTAKEMRRYARVCNLPVHKSTCPHIDTGMRAQVGNWLKQLRRKVPAVYVNVYRAAEKYVAKEKRSPRAGRGRGEKTEDQAI